MAADIERDNAADFNPFRELTKTFDQFKMPGADLHSFVDARRKDVEALVAANRITYEALQALAHMQTDMLTQAMQGMQGLVKDGVAGNTRGGDMTNQADAAQTAWPKMLTDMKQLAEMAQKAQVEAMAGLTERAMENMGEMRGLAHTK